MSFQYFIELNGIGIRFSSLFLKGGKLKDELYRWKTPLGNLACYVVYNLKIGCMPYFSVKFISNELVATGGVTVDIE